MHLQRIVYQYINVPEQTNPFHLAIVGMLKMKYNGSPLKHISCTLIEQSVHWSFNIIPSSCYSCLRYVCTVVVYICVCVYTCVCVCVMSTHTRTHTHGFPTDNIPFPDHVYLAIKMKYIPP